jgi:hypothetical protein
MDVDDVGAADSSWHIYEVLCQDEQWVDQDGAVHRVAEMEREHVVNLLRWLHRHALGIALGCARFLTKMPMPAGDIAFGDVAGDVGRELSRMGNDPVGWLGDTELVTALRARLTGAETSFSGPFPQVKPGI